MANKALVRLEKAKSYSTIDKMFKHNFRQDYCENVDKSRSHLNEVLIDMGASETYKSCLKKRIKESSYYATHRVRKDAVLGMDINLSFGRKETVGPEFDLDLWKQQSVEWLQSTFGKENVVSAVLHLDESQPHIHAFVIPMHEERLNCKKFSGGKKQMRELQSTYGEKMQNLGLERGVEYSVAKHEEIQAFYGAIKERQIEKLPECIPGESTEQYRARAQASFVTARMQDLKKMNDLNHENASLKGYQIKTKIRDKEIEELKRELDKKNTEIESYEKRLRRWTEILYGITNKIPSEQMAIETFANIKEIAEAARKDMEEKNIDYNTVYPANKEEILSD